MAEFMADQNGGFEKNIGVQDALRNLDLAKCVALHLHYANSMSTHVDTVL